MGATPDHWLKFNGFSNKGKGWGGEDDVLYNRMRNARLLTSTKTRQGWRPVLKRPEKGFGRCESLSEGHTERTRDARGYAEILKVRCYIPCCTVRRSPSRIGEDF